MIEINTLNELTLIIWLNKSNKYIKKVYDNLEWFMFIL